MLLKTHLPVSPSTLQDSCSICMDRVRKLLSLVSKYGGQNIGQPHHGLICTFLWWWFETGEGIFISMHKNQGNESKWVTASELCSSRWFWRHSLRDDEWGQGSADEATIQWANAIKTLAQQKHNEHWHLISLNKHHPCPSTTHPMCAAQCGWLRWTRVLRRRQGGTYVLNKLPSSCHADAK